MPISSNKYKQMSIKEFTKAAKIYDSGKSGIYEICKYDYPKVLTELKNTKFIVGDCENLPFEDESYDVIICTNSFHHYPNHYGCVCCTVLADNFGFRRRKALDFQTSVYTLEKLLSDIT